MELLSMAFDAGDCFFDFHRCLYKYNGQEYMLYTGNKERHMSIDTIVNSIDNFDLIFEQIHEFFYSFGWETKSYFHFLGISSMRPANKEILVKRNSPLLNYPRTFFRKISFSKILNLNNQVGLKIALSLYNDAKYSNDIFYSFYCLYKIFDISINGNTRNPAIWINSNINNIKINNNNLKNFIKSQTDLGLFIQDECRNAIAHIHRNTPNKTSILSYRLSDFEKITYAKIILEKLVPIFIENEIGLPKNKNIDIIKIDKK